MGTGSRQENAIKQREKHFQAKHAPAKAGVGTGSRKENATKLKRKSIRADSVSSKNALERKPI